MATNLAEAFVRLYVEDNLTPVLDRLPGRASDQAGQAGAAVTQAFGQASQQAVASVGQTTAALDTIGPAAGRAGMEASGALGALGGTATGTADTVKGELGAALGDVGSQAESGAGQATAAVEGLGTATAEAAEMSRQAIAEGGTAYQDLVGEMSGAHVASDSLHAAIVEQAEGATEAERAVAEAATGVADELGAVGPAADQGLGGIGMAAAEAAKSTATVGTAAEGSREAFGPLADEAKALGPAVASSHAPIARLSDLMKTAEGATKGLGKAQKEASSRSRDSATATEKLSISASDTQRSVRRLGTTLLSDVNPALGKAAEGGLEMARSFSGMGVAAGGAGAALAAVAIAVGLYIAKIKEGIEFTTKLAIAQRNADLGAIEGQLKANAAAMERWSEQERLATQDVTSLRTATERIITYWQQAFGPTLEELQDRTEQLSVAATAAFAVFERPKLDIASLKDAATALERSSRASATAATTAEDYTKATAQLVRARGQLAEVDRRQIAEEIKRLTLQKQMKEIGAEVADARIADARRRLAAITRDLALDEADLARERDKNIRALEEAERKHAVALQVQQEDSQRNRLRAAVGFAAEMAKTRTTSAIQQTQIVHQQALDEAQIDEQAFAARRARLQREADLLAQQPQTKETIEQARALQLQLGALDEERAKSREALAGRLLQLETQLAQQVRAVQESERTARKALGDVTIAEERARLDSIIGDVTRSEQERITAITNRVQIAKQAEQGYWDFLKARGDVTVQDELDRQQKIVDATKAGTAERLAEETKLAAAQKTLRDQALSAGERLRQEAIEALKAEGKQRISNMDIERRSAALQQGHLETLAQAAAGAAVDVDKLQKAAQMAPTFKQLRDTGVSAADAMRSAFTATTKQAGLAKTATSALETELAGLQKELADIKLKEAMRAALDAPKQIADATAKAYSAVLSGTDDFMKTWGARIKSGASTISDDLVQVFLAKTTKRLQEESRRL